MRPLLAYAPPWGEPASAGLELSPRVHSLAVSDDGRHLAAVHASGRRETEVFDLASGRRVLSWTHASNATSFAVFHPGGEGVLVEGGGRGVLVTLDGAAREVASFALPERAQHAAIHPDGGHAVVAGHGSQAGTLTLVDLGSVRLRATLPTGRPLAAALGQHMDAMQDAMRSQLETMLADPGMLEKVMQKARAMLGRAGGGAPERAGLESRLEERMARFRVQAERSLSEPRGVRRDSPRLTGLSFDSRGRWLLASSDRGILAWAWDELLAARDEAPEPRVVGPLLRAASVIVMPGPGARSASGPLWAHQAVHDRARDRVLFTLSDGTVHSADLINGADVVLLACAAGSGDEAIGHHVRIALSTDGAALLTIDSEIPRGGGMAGARLRVWDFGALFAQAAAGGAPAGT